MDKDKIKKISKYKLVTIYLLPTPKDLRNEGEFLVNQLLPLIKDKMNKIGLKLVIKSLYLTDDKVFLENGNQINIVVGLLGGHYDLTLEKIIQEIIVSDKLHCCFYFGRELDYYDKVTYYENLAISLVEKLRIINSNEMKQAELKSLISDKYEIKYFTNKVNLVELVIQDIKKVIDNTLEITEVDYNNLIKYRKNKNLFSRLKSIFYRS